VVGASRSGTAGLFLERFLARGGGTGRIRGASGCVGGYGKGGVRPEGRQSRRSGRGRARGDKAGGQRRKI